MSKISAVLALALVACGAHPQQPKAAHPAATPLGVPEQIISKSESGSARELFERGDRALVAGDFEQAKNALETLVAAWRAGSTDARDELEPRTLASLALAYEGLGRRAQARDTYLELERRFADHVAFRAARTRLFSVLAYLDDWDGLAAAADRALTTAKLEPFDRMGALGARGLARIEKGDDANAARDVQEGLDIMETLRIGEAGRLPTPAAMLKLAQAEVRRVRSERFVVSRDGSSVTSAKDLEGFMPKLEARCQGLMEAQRTYADAMRAQDPFFLAFGAYRVGEMYRALHKDLMKIPPTEKAKTDEQRDLFFAMMHVRYRVLLEKAHDMMTRTLAMAAPPAPATPAQTPSRDPDFAQWVKRADAAKAEIEKALDEERAYIAKLPYNEATVQRALDMLKERTLARQAQSEPKTRP